MAGDQELSVTGGARLRACGIIRFVVLVFSLVASNLLLSGLSFAQQCFFYFGIEARKMAT